MSMLSMEFWIAVAEIVTVNIVLSGDNAVVIALACRNLPPRQRRLGVFWGVFGAVAARVVLTAFAAALLALPYLKLIGAALLLWIGVQLIVGNTGEPSGSGKARDVHASERLWSAIYTVVMADVIMSLDNVVGVAAAAHGSLPLLVFGLVLSIPIVVVGSGLFMKMIERAPVLVVAGGGLLGYIAGQMATTDPIAVPLLEPHLWLEALAPIAGLVLVVATGMALVRVQRRSAERVKP